MLDLDGNGVNDLAVGADEAELGGGEEASVNSMGSVTLLYLDKQGGNIVEINRVQIDESDPLLTDLDTNDAFGASLALLGDVDGDPTTIELAVGAFLDDEIAADAGRVWILSIQPGTGAVTAASRLFPLVGSLDAGDRFGHAVAYLGDLDGAGPSTYALAVGATRDDDFEPGNSQSNNGAIYILFLDQNLNVLSQQKLSTAVGGIPFSGNELSWFGASLAWAGLPAGGGGVLYAGSEAQALREAVYPLSIGPDGLVRAAYVIRRNNGAGFTTALSSDEDGFGDGIAVIPDLDGDQDLDLAVGAAKGCLEKLKPRLEARAGNPRKRSAQRGEGAHPGSEGGAPSGVSYAR